MLSGSTSAQTGGAALVGGDFSDALAQATGADASSAMTEPTAVAASAGTTLGSLDGAGSALDDAGSGASLPGSTSTLLTSRQQQFASTLSADTGLNPSVVSAWLLSEEPGGATQSRQAAGNNDCSISATPIPAPTASTTRCGPILSPRPTRPRSGCKVRARSPATEPPAPGSSRSCSPLGRRRQLRWLRYSSPVGRRAGTRTWVRSTRKSPKPSR